MGSGGRHPKRRHAGLDPASIPEHPIGVDAHGGMLTLANRAEGGLRATMRLPV